MKLPELQDADRYTGLFIVDFEDHCGVGFRAEEVAELLESEQFSEIQIYKIHRAYPDGRLELKGISKDIFELEGGVLFYASSTEMAHQDFKRLSACAEQIDPPARAKIHLSRFAQDSHVTTLIYPAEYDDSFSHWLLDCQYRTAGTVEGGVGAVERYYSARPEILQRKQIFNRASVILSGENLMAAAKRAVVR